MFGDESEAAIVKVMRLREQLRPYVMEQYEAAAAHGTPIMRPLFFDFHTDSGSQGIDDQLVRRPSIVLRRFDCSQADLVPAFLCRCCQLAN